MRPSPGRWLRSGLAGLLIGLGWATAGCGSPEPEPVFELLPLPPQRDLSAADPKVQAQFAERRGFLDRLLEQGSASDSGLAYAFGELGRLHHAYHEFELASRCYRNAAGLDPEEPRWPYLLAQIERTEGRLEASNEWLAKVLALRPDDVPARVWRGENAFDQQRFEAAGQDFATALADDPACLKARVGLARVAIEAGDLEAAAAHLEQTLEAQPAASEPRYLLAQVVRDLGDWEKARGTLDSLGAEALERVALRFVDPWMQEVADLRQSAQTAARRGMQALVQGQRQKALESFRTAVDLDPNRPDTRYNLAALLLQAGQRTEAREHLEGLVTVAPEYAQARILLARILDGAGEGEAAIEHLEQAIGLDSESSRAYLALAEMRADRGQLTTAEGLFLRATELEPSLRPAWGGLGWVLERAGRPGEATDPVRRALRLCPEGGEEVDDPERWLEVLRQARRPAEVDRRLCGGAGTVANSP